MNNIEGTRSSFFPGQRKSVNARTLNHTMVDRNNLDRKQQLESLTKDDAKVKISNAIKDFSRIKKAVDAAPEIDNSERIAALKAQIKDGTYKIDYDALADKMIESEF